MIAHPPHITQLLLDLRRPKQLKGCLRLYELAGSDGMAILVGGVRGWAETLGCGLSYPKILFAELEALEIISDIEYFPGDGGQVAYVYLQRDDSITDRHHDEAALLELEAGSHQNAILIAPDRSLIVPPCTPHVDDHDSSQQQQHAHARENTTPDRRPETGLTHLLRAEFPHADLALLDAWEANPQVNDCKAARDALAGYPKATLADWKTDLASAEDRPSVSWPVGLVLACWAQSERVAPRRTPPVAPPPAPSVPRQRGREVRAVEARAPEALSDREIRADTDLTPEDRAAFLAAYEAAPDDAARAEVLCDFRRFWAAWFEEQLAQERAVGAVGVESAAQLVQIAPLWQAAMGAVQLRMSRQKYDIWLRGARLLALEASLATVMVPSPLHKEGFEHHYQDLVRRALGDVVGFPVQMRVVVEGGA